MGEFNCKYKKAI